MPYHRRTRSAMYNTPAIRTGGFGALQVEALTNRPLSIARRHLAASQLRMRDIEPDELSSSEWCQFLVMEVHERDRWIAGFSARRRRGSDESSNASSSSIGESSQRRPQTTESHPTPFDRTLAYDKAEEARAEAEDELYQQRQEQERQLQHQADFARTPAASLWARQFDQLESADGDEGVSSGHPDYTARRPRHARRAVTVGGLAVESPPTYENAVRARTPPPAYQPRRLDE